MWSTTSRYIWLRERKWAWRYLAVDYNGPWLSFSRWGIPLIRLPWRFTRSINRDWSEQFIGPHEWPSAGHSKRCTGSSPGHVQRSVDDCIYICISRHGVWSPALSDQLDSTPRITQAEEFDPNTTAWGRPTVTTTTCLANLSDYIYANECHLQSILSNCGVQ